MCKLVQIDNECILFGQVFVSLVNFHVLFALQVQGLIPLHLILNIGQQGLIHLVIKNIVSHLILAGLSSIGIWVR